jgi:uncharacterized protein (TIGR03437 family)
MKCFQGLFLLAAVAFAQPTFTTGQAARAVIGQETFTAANPSSSATVVGAISGLAYANDTLFVADSNRVNATPINNRVLLFSNVSSFLPAPQAQLTYDRKCPVCVGQANVVLGQPDFTSAAENTSPTQNSLRTPTAVASDGVHLVIADTDDNRVLIWNHIPATINQPADVVVGQPNFTTGTIPGNTPNAKSMRGPQGVWIQNGKLYVADTQNNRVLIYNNIPTTSGVAADVVLGQPNFTTLINPDIAQQTTSASASNMLDPVSVTSDGIHLYVTDLGYNRVLIWNSIPTANGASADVVVGQPDMVSSVANNAYTGAAATTAGGTGQESPVLCTLVTGTDPNGNPTYPPLCNKTLSFPRFALSDGTRLFIADGGNDRVLVFEQIPVQNAAGADEIIGESDPTLDLASDATDSMITPMSLAWDGTNLYVSDTYNMRILVYSLGANLLPFAAVRNAASFSIHATGAVTLGGTITSNNTVTIQIQAPSWAPNGGYAACASTDTTCQDNNSTNYTYTVLSTDTLQTVAIALTDLINGANGGAGDTYVYAAPDLTTDGIVLVARVEGSNGNDIGYTATVAASSSSSSSSSTTATITATAADAMLDRGGNAADIGPGTMVSVVGYGGLSDTTASANPNAPLPTTLAGVQLYLNGIPTPLFYVSPMQINAQVPWEFTDTDSVNAYVRIAHNDGSVTVTLPVAMPVVTQNPGIFTLPSSAVIPAALAYHASSYATGVVSVDGTAVAGDSATVTIVDRSYTYTVQSGDTLDTIRDALVTLINQDPVVSATAADVFDRIILSARSEGPDANGIPYGGSTSSGASVTITPFTTALCCANVAGAQVTPDNPALAGENIYVVATGLGLPVTSDASSSLVQTGNPYPVGAPDTIPVNFVSGLIGGVTINILGASLLQGAAPGEFKVLLNLGAGSVTDPAAQLWIAQDVYVSNIVTVPILNPTPSTSASSTASVRKRGAVKPSEPGSQSGAPQSQQGRGRVRNLGDTIWRDGITNR